MLNSPQNLGRQHALSGAMKLLAGESQGFAIDATTMHGPAYVGGPYGGSVAVTDTTTPANNLFNVSLDASNLTNAGTSPKVVIWNDGTVRWTPHNLVLQSQTIDNATWAPTALTITANDTGTTAPDGTITAEKILATNSSTSVLQLTTQLAVLANTVYTLSVYVKPNGITWYYFQGSGSSTNGAGAYFNLSNGTVGNTVTTTWTNISQTITSVGNGWWRLSVTFNPGADTVCGIYTINTTTNGGSTRDTTNTVWLWGAQLNRGYSATPYLATTSAARYGIPQEYDVANSRFGLLLEPAATNLFLQSSNLAATWVALNATTTSDTTAGPDGSTTADSLNEDNTASAAHAYSQTTSVTSGTVYTFSVYLKKAGRSWVRLSFGGLGFQLGTASQRSAWFDLSNGVKGTVGSSISFATMTSIGNGWYRCSVTDTADTTDVGQIFVCSQTADTELTYSGSAQASIYFWGAQFETGTVATSHIPTLGSTVTRALDIVTAASSTIPFSTTVGSMLVKVEFAEATAVLDTNSPSIIEFDDGTLNNRLQLQRIATTNLSQFTVVAAAATQAAPQSSALNGQPTIYKFAAAWAANDFTCCVNQTMTGAPDNAGTVPTGITTLRMAMNATPAGRVNERIYQFIYYNRRLADAELQSKTI